MFYNDGPRTWKYAVPGALAILLFWSVWVLPAGSGKYTWLLVLLGAWCAWIALMNFWKLFSSHKEDMHEQHMRALSITPLVLLSHNMRQMHPEAIKVLNRFGARTSWQVRVGKNFGERDWVLADTNVHFGFIEFVLSKSNGSLYPKNQFHEGSKKWDPDGLVEDREQYSELESWLFSRMMVTRAHGDHRPAEFIPPWTPKLILETMGLSGEQDQDLYRPEDYLKLKDLTATDKQTKTAGLVDQAWESVPMQTLANHEAATADNVDELTEEDMVRLAAENADYAANMVARSRRLQNLKQFRS